jgi:hypothetical protein
VQFNLGIQVHVFCEHLSAVDEPACNPKPKSGRQTGRYPINAGHNDLAKDNLVAYYCAVLVKTFSDSCDVSLLPNVEGVHFSHGI